MVKKLQRAITPPPFQLIDSKFNQVISFSVPISTPNIKALAQILFETSHAKEISMLFYLLKGKLL